MATRDRPRVPGARERSIGRLLVALAALLAYASTVDNYFAQDDFGVVWLLSQKPLGYFPQWFASTWMDDIWGYTPDEVRPFPALSYQLAALWGAGSPAANHVVNVGFHIGVGLLVHAVASTAAGLTPLAATLAALVFVLLPNQAETVAWITGRVDSMPALFYLASFLAFVRWRATGRSTTYLWSVVWCFVALFSKQNTITLVPALMLFDVVIARRAIRASWPWLRPYLPFVVLTGGYLLLRYELFGQVAREGLMTQERLPQAAREIAGHLARVIFGNEAIRPPSGVLVLLPAVVFGWRWLVAIRRHDPFARQAVRTMLFFLLGWMLLGLAPSLVSGYSSTRHAYLAAVGWAIALGIAFDVVTRGERRRATRAAAIATMAVLVAMYAVQLRGLVAEWDTRTAVSASAVAALEREALAAPEGSLIVIGVPGRSWDWALPFAARPPFAAANLTERVSIISPSSLHCCGPIQWEEYTRKTLSVWEARRDRPPVIAMNWDDRTGRMMRLSENDEPALRPLLTLLLETADHTRLDENMRRLLREFVGLHARAS